MCTMISEKTNITGSGKSDNRWIPINSCDVYFDHPDHVDCEHAIMLSFCNQNDPINSRISLEITPESAKAIIEKINLALAKGEKVTDNIL